MYSPSRLVCGTTIPNLFQIWLKRNYPHIHLVFSNSCWPGDSNVGMACKKCKIAHTFYVYDLIIEDIPKWDFFKQHIHDGKQLSFNFELS